MVQNIDIHMKDCLTITFYIILTPLFYMICIICGRLLEPDEEPIIVEEMRVSRRIQEGRKRSCFVLGDLRCHRRCFHKIMDNINNAEDEQSGQLEKQRRKDREEGLR